MSNRDIPAFDALSGEGLPYSGFGKILPVTPERVMRLKAAIADAQKRVSEGFGFDFHNPAEAPKHLDAIVADMWNTGWDPKTGNVNVFTRDFGLVLTESILGLLGGALMLRAEQDLSHLSIFWVDFKIEAFPFHKVLKCLYRRHGESMASFVAGLAKCVNPNPR